MKTTLRLPQIREAIISELSTLLLPIGYKIKNRRGENSFIHKIDSGYTEIQFFYDNYEPIDYTVQVKLRFYQNTIQGVIKKFSESINRKYIELPNLFYSEGDFVDSLKGKLIKYRAGFKNRLVDESDLVKLIDYYKQLIAKEFIPLENYFISIENTSVLLYKNRDNLVRDGSENMLMTSLISMKLCNSPHYEETYRYYQDELLKNDGVYDLVTKKALILMKDLHSFLNR